MKTYEVARADGIESLTLTERLSLQARIVKS
jgi:hypothetical protein